MVTEPAVIGVLGDGYLPSLRLFSPGEVWPRGTQKLWRAASGNEIHIVEGLVDDTNLLHAKKGQK